MIKESIDNNSITQDGELIHIHKDILESIAKDIILIGAIKEIKHKEAVDEVIQYKESNNYIHKTLGDFYIHYYNNIPEEIEKQYKFRYIYLCCLLKYNDNRLMYKKDNGRYELIKEGDLIDVLKLSERETRNTKISLLKHNLISIDSDKNIIINNKISFMGKISNKKDKDYSRLFKEGVVSLYNNSLKTEHKKMVIFIELLPYINLKYNIICNNPDCEVMEDIDPFTLKDIVDNFNIGKNMTRVRRDLLNLTIKNEKLLLMISDYNKSFFVVNPRLYYKGNNIDDLNYLTNLFRV